MRDAVGPDVELMVDCHSFFDVPLAERVAQRLEPLNLAWYEEPVAPERIDETRDIRRRDQTADGRRRGALRRCRLRAARRTGRSTSSCPT